MINNIIKKYEGCCREIQSIKEDIENIVRLHSVDNSYFSIDDLKDCSSVRYEGYREKFCALNHFSAVKAGSLGLKCTMPLHPSIYREVSLKEKKLTALYDDLDRIVEDIVNTWPENSSEALERLIFLLNYMAVHPGVERDYFIFALLESALIIDEGTNREGGGLMRDKSA